nr:DUF2157 domain-containing protein [uncultured Flavobacterium sp.]
MAIPKKDLDELLHANVITSETVRDIEQYYLSKKQQSVNPLLAIFGALGGILVGLGIILIFAHNWDNFSRHIKTLLAFTPLLLSQLFTAYCILKNKSASFKETASALVFFSVGASISLVAQIYNISGDFPQFILTWSLVCAPLIYLLRSNTAVVLHLIMSTVYVISKGSFTYPHEVPYMYLLLMALVIPYYYQQIKNDAHSRMTLTLHILVPTALIVGSNVFFTHVSYIGGFSFLLYVVFYGLMYIAGKQPQLGRTYKIVGAIGLMVILFFASFREVWNDLDTDKAPAGYIIAFFVMLACCALLTAKNIKGKDMEPVQFLPFVVLVIYLISFTSNGLAAVITNLLTLATGLWYVKKGIDQVRYITVNFGLLIITILAGCRFFDTDLSFVIRGLLFVGVGAGFFVANYAVSKRKQQTLKPQHHEN